MITVGKYIFTSSINVFMPTLYIAIYESMHIYSYIIVWTYRTYSYYGHNKNYYYLFKFINVFCKILLIFSGEKWQKT